jgi:hypothetical protein
VTVTLWIDRPWGDQIDSTEDNYEFLLYSSTASRFMRRHPSAFYQTDAQSLPCMQPNPVIIAV